MNEINSSRGVWSSKYGNCSVYAHTDCLNKSGGEFVGVFVILFAWKKHFAYWKILGGYNVQKGQILVLLANHFGGWIYM